jgi:hypothetical protein
MAVIEPELFTGCCVVCGAVFSIRATPGEVDYNFRGEKMVIQARHYATAPPGADPRCAKYFSELEGQKCS